MNNRKFTVVLVSTFGDMDVKFENVEAFNSEQATNRVLSQFSHGSHWVVVDCTSEYELNDE